MRQRLGGEPLTTAYYLRTKAMTNPKPDNQQQIEDEEEPTQYTKAVEEILTIFRGDPSYPIEQATQAIERIIKIAELRARIDERKQVALDNYNGHTFSKDTGWEGKFGKFVRNNEKRIIQLQAIKEAHHATED